MCDEAKQYAQTLLNRGHLVHSPSSERSGQGENLAMGCSTSAAQPIEEAVTNWWVSILRSCYADIRLDEVSNSAFENKLEATQQS